MDLTERIKAQIAELKQAQTANRQRIAQFQEQLGFLLRDDAATTGAIAALEKVLKDAGVPAESPI